MQPKREAPPAGPDDYPVLAFNNQPAFRAWLQRNHVSAKGIWIRFDKKSSGRKTLSYAEALDEALCFGWIDGLVRRFDQQSWIQKFTPRRVRSRWSKRNTEHVERLIAAGAMTDAGLAEVRRAQEDGRWSQAYCSPGEASPPADFLRALEENPAAKAFFATLNRANVYYVVYQLGTAKRPETRERRMQRILTALSARRPFHPSGAQRSLAAKAS